MESLLEIIMNTDEALIALVSDYGTVTYIILFLIVFSETGLVFFPFLPGDALLFSAGVVSATDALNVWILIAVFIAAALLGNTSNYFVGRYASSYFLKIKNQTFQRYMKESRDFYEERGGMAIVVSRFFPILRTYVPFIAGISHMDAVKYTTYNVLGGLGWVFLFVLGGNLLGGIPGAKENFEFVLLGILIMTITPFIYKTIQAFRGK